MDINLKDVQKWYANKINKQVIELDSYDLFCAKVAYDYACETLSILAVVWQGEQLVCKCGIKEDLKTRFCIKCKGDDILPDHYLGDKCLDCGGREFDYR